MRTYFFNVFNDEITHDDEGLELSDDEAALNRAITEARELAAESVRKGHLVGHHRVEVLDRAGALIGIVRFDEAVAIS